MHSMTQIRNNFLYILSSIRQSTFHNEHMNKILICLASQLQKDRIQEYKTIDFCKFDLFNAIKQHFEDIFEVKLLFKEVNIISFKMYGLWI